MLERRFRRQFAARGPSSEQLSNRSPCPKDAALSGQSATSPIKVNCLCAVPDMWSCMCSLQQPPLSQTGVEPWLPTGRTSTSIFRASPELGAVFVTAGRSAFMRNGGCSKKHRQKQHEYLLLLVVVMTRPVACRVARVRRCDVLCDSPRR